MPLGPPIQIFLFNHEKTFRVVFAVACPFRFCHYTGSAERQRERRGFSLSCDIELRPLFLSGTPPVLGDPLLGGHVAGLENEGVDQLDSACQLMSFFVLGRNCPNALERQFGLDIVVEAVVIGE